MTFTNDSSILNNCIRLLKVQDGLHLSLKILHHLLYLCSCYQSKLLPRLENHTEGALDKDYKMW